MLTLPKFKIDPASLHSARRKLLTGKASAINEEEKQALLTLISAGKRRLYPTETAVNLCQYRYHLIANKPDMKQRELDELADEIESFEEQYCR